MSEQAVEVTRNGGVAVASLRGDIDMINHDEMLSALLHAALDHGPRFVLDLTRVQYVDSNGVRMLFELANELAQSRVEWAVALDDDSPIMRLLKVTAFNDVVQIFCTTSDAATALGGE
ncbi:MAG: hypothetical protein QOK28_2655 [Actinomycetota bacterium]|jgi:stage II sporulation protein AA (anti-sigma F factor antagonist)